MEYVWNRAQCEKRLAQLSFPSPGEEMGFSWSPCGLCGSTLGGDRHHIAHADDDTEAHPVHGVLVPIGRVRACTDCMVYLANGTLPGE